LVDHHNENLTYMEISGIRQSVDMQFYLTEFLNYLLL